MNYGKYDTICCKQCFYLLICNELSCIDPGNQLLIITKTINIIKILQPSNSKVFLYDYFYRVKKLNIFRMYLKIFARKPIHKKN